MNQGKMPHLSALRPRRHSPGTDQGLPCTLRGGGWAPRAQGCGKTGKANRSLGPWGNEGPGKDPYSGRGGCVSVCAQGVHHAQGTVPRGLCGRRPHSSHSQGSV